MKFRDSTIIMFFTAFYIATLIAANTTAGKLFDFYGISVSVGAFAYMICLATSDVVVDIYGPKLGYRLVTLGVSMNICVLLLYQLAVRLPIASGQEALQSNFEGVFAASTSVIVASIIGYPITEYLEVYFWRRLKTATHQKHMWFRNGVIAIGGQLLDATIFFNLAFFVFPRLFYDIDVIPATDWWDVMEGAWLYGLWKGIFLGTFDYPILWLIIPWIRSHRVADIPELDEVVQQEEWAGNW